MIFFQKALFFLVALGPLIIFHELGHFLVARLCGVKVLRFSVGMGKVVWSRRFGKDGTEWAVSMLPLGGYVKMLDSRDPDAGPVSPEDAKREFTRQNVWRRIAIIAAGPLANFLLATLIFAGLYMHGVDEAGTRLRAMPENTPAWQAGLRGGDQVKAVNGTALVAWTELRWEILQAVIDKAEARIDIERPGAGQFSFVVPASATRDLNPESDVLGALGLSMARPPARLSGVDPAGPGARAGLQKDDVVTAIDGQAVIDGIALSQAVRSSGGRTLQMEVNRAGQTLTLAVTPQRDKTGKSWQVMVLMDMNPEIVKLTEGPIGAVATGARMTWSSAVMQVKMMGKIVTGELSLKNITGPITIADYAGQTASLGPAPFLSFIAMISIALGVMNLLPIPVLDGGLLLYYSVEVLTGRPLPERIGEYAQRAGVGLLVMLMALAVFNDVARLL